MCCNYLDPMGKWGGNKFLFGTVIAVFVFMGGLLTLRAYELDSVSTGSNQQEKFKFDLDPINKVNDITAPVNNLIKGALNILKLNQGIDIGTGIPVSLTKRPIQTTDFSKFFSSSKISFNDLIGFLKEAAITSINLTMLIISITTQILKGLLSIIE